MNNKEIKSGQIWKCPARNDRDSIIVKVLEVFPDKVFIMRKTHYGFTDLKPMHMTPDEFTFVYEYVGEVIE